MAKRPGYHLPSFQWSNHRPLIEVRELEKVFKTLAGPTRVLKGIDLEIGAGEFVSIIGRSGSGKSTLINMLTGIDHPTSGQVRIGDTVLAAMPEGKMAEWRGKTVGIVFQFFQLLPTLTLLENVLLPMDFCDMYPPMERIQRAERLLEQVGLQEWKDQLPGAVSGGQQQCVAVARAVANDPPILVADEPTGNLDSASAEGVLAFFDTLVGEGKTILMVTHDRKLAQRTDRSILLSDGEIIKDGIVRAFAGLPDEKLLHLSQKGVCTIYAAGADVPAAGSGVGGEVLVVQKGALRLLGCEAEELAFPVGSWLDIPWLSSACPAGRLQAAAGANLELIRIPRADFEQATGGQVTFTPPGGGS
jgi:ABC-type lipoprotein export system ATPase subunit